MAPNREGGPSAPAIHTTCMNFSHTVNCILTIDKKLVVYVWIKKSIGVDMAGLDTITVTIIYWVGDIY